MRRIITAVVAATIFSGQFGAGGTALAAGINRTTVRPYGTDVYERYFEEGEMVTVRVRGNHATDLDLSVDCPCGRTLAIDDDDNDDCVVRFRAPEDGLYTIRVENLDDLSNRYTIVVD
jgi:hypothetical protein